MEVDTDKLHLGIAEWAYDNYPEEDITSVYVTEQVGHSYRPQMHRMYMTDVAVLYRFGPDGFEKKGYQIPYKTSADEDIDTLGSVRMAEFVDNQIQRLSPNKFDSQPQPIEFDGHPSLIDAIINRMNHNDADGFEIIRSE
jgi:hypothetical protein